MSTVLELAGVTLGLESDWDLGSQLEDVVPPVIRFEADEPDVGWTLRLVSDDSLRPDRRQRRTWYLTDGLGDGHMMSWASIREWNDNGVELLYHDAEADLTCRVTSDFSARRTTVIGPPSPQNRRPLRLIRLFFGHRLLNAGWAPFHAASFVLDGAGILCCGAPGAGKSTVAFLAATLGGAQFLADDVSLVRGARSPQVIGWPTRIGVTRQLVSATMAPIPPDLARLRHPTLAPPVSDEESPARVLRGARYSLDRTEHRSIFAATHGSPSALRLVVILETDPATTAPTLSQLSRETLDSALPGYLASSEEARFLVDVLGLFGPYRVPKRVVPPNLWTVPAVRLQWGIDPSGQGEALSMIRTFLPSARPGS